MACPTPWKVTYPTPAAARKDIKRIARRANKRKARGSYSAPSHAYRCECGMFHLTTQKSKPKQRRRRQELMADADYDWCGCDYGSGW